MAPTATKIHVRNRDLGFFTQTLITVQRFEIEDGDPVVVWCNHAGAIEEEYDVQINNVDRLDEVYQQTIIACNKCGASRLPGENYWENAPFEGVTEERTL